jgi:quercetin dioxygenase-like cupin family protein
VSSRALAVVAALIAPALLGAQATVTSVTQQLPPLNGDHLKVHVVEVTYAPGASSRPHSHPCPVIGRVIEGTLRTQVKGDTAQVLGPGATFYEPANGVHLFSGSASATQPVRFLAIFVCDNDEPLSTPASP